MEIIMPKMGDAMTEGKVVRWYKKAALQGDRTAMRVFEDLQKKKQRPLREATAQATTPQGRQ